MKNKFLKLIIPVLFLAAAISIIVFKNQNKNEEMRSSNQPVIEKQLPKLLDLGSRSCIPCKMMMPILDTLRDIHKGKLKVEFMDVREDREAGMTYGIRAIPTQIIFDANGKELFRHEGFWSRQEMEQKMVELGVLVGDSH